VDSAGQATIGGATYSINYPITSNGLRQTDEGGFVTTLNSAGTTLAFSTVLNHVLQLNFKRDLAGNYYVGGSAGTNLPVTSNAFQKSFPAVGTEIHLGFLTVIDSTGALAYSSYIAGNPPSTNLETHRFSWFRLPALPLSAIATTIPHSQLRTGPLSRTPAPSWRGSTPKRLPEARLSSTRDALRSI
jgi:hypothetical protein